MELFGSLGATGKGHGSIPAVALGLMGERPDAVDPERTPERIDAITSSGQLSLLGEHPIAFDLDDDIVLHRTQEGAVSRQRAWCFGHLAAAAAVVAPSGRSTPSAAVSSSTTPRCPAATTIVVVADQTSVRYPFLTGDELLAHAAETGLRISDIVMANEMAWHTEEHVRSGFCASGR